MLNINENDIIKNWTSNKLVVSIACTCFNHEKYIKQALDSFLSQKTIFAFEIIVHDDASTDNSVKILKKYKAKYPSIIKLILQTENQYSQNKKVLPIIFNNAIGKYIAICEGDDFWLSETKLQEQFDAMVKYPDINISFHPAEQFNNDSPDIRTTTNYHGKNTKIIDVKDIILGGGGFCPTASLMIKKECLDKIPSWINYVHAGDYYIQVLAALDKGALYLPNTNSAYRYQSTNSSTAALRSNTNKQKLETVIKKEVRGHDELYKMMPEHLKPFLTIKKAILLQEMGTLAMKQNFPDLFDNWIKESWKTSSFISIKQTFLYYGRHFIFILKLIQKLRWKIYKW